MTYHIIQRAEADRLDALYRALTLTPIAARVVLERTDEWLRLVERERAAQFLKETP